MNWTGDLLGTLGAVGMTSNLVTPLKRENRLGFKDKKKSRLTVEERATQCRVASPRLRVIEPVGPS